MSSSWEKASKWYGALVGEKGHYYHEHVIFPNLKKQIHWKVEKPSLLDLACGTSPLLQIVPQNVSYTGVDLSTSLIAQAKKRKIPHKTQWQVGDITKPLDLPENHFSHATIILALQNVNDLEAALANAARHLRPSGQLIIVLNHPAFRVPRQSSWHIDAKRNLQQRCIDSYMSEMEVPIQMHPGKNGDSLPSFHFPLHVLSRALGKSGFLIERIDEWCSNKKSQGAAAKRENRARREFPLFLSVSALKKSV